jgi:hypothetical protein
MVPICARRDEGLHIHYRWRRIQKRRHKLHAVQFTKVPGRAEMHQAAHQAICCQNPYTKRYFLFTGRWAAKEPSGVTVPSNAGRRPDDPKSTDFRIAKRYCNNTQQGLWTLPAAPLHKVRSQKRTSNETRTVVRPGGPGPKPRNHRSPPKKKQSQLNAISKLCSCKRRDA